MSAAFGIFRQPHAAAQTLHAPCSACACLRPGPPRHPTPINRAPAIHRLRSWTHVAGQSPLHGIASPTRPRPLFPIRPARPSSPALVSFYSPRHAARAAAVWQGRRPRFPFVTACTLPWPLQPPGSSDPSRSRPGDVILTLACLPNQAPELREIQPPAARSPPTRDLWRCPAPGQRQRRRRRQRRWRRRRRDGRGDGPRRRTRPRKQILAMGLMQTRPRFAAQPPREGAARGPCATRHRLASLISDTRPGASASLAVRPRMGRRS